MQYLMAEIRPKAYHFIFIISMYLPVCFDRDKNVELTLTLFCGVVLRSAFIGSIKCKI